MSPYKPDTAGPVLQGDAREVAEVVEPLFHRPSRRRPILAMPTRTSPTNGADVDGLVFFRVQSNGRLRSALELERTP